MDKKLAINVDKLMNGDFDEAFLSSFCELVVPKIAQFKIEFGQLLMKGDRERLNMMVHEMMGTLRFLEREDLCEVINRYKSIEGRNETEMRVLIDEVAQHFGQIEEALIQLNKS